MNCSCIKGNYDFILQSMDCSKVLYQDLSDWMMEDYYTVPDTYSIEVLVPNRKSFVSLEVNANSFTVITPEALGLKSKCIVDGVYCFKVDNCGTVYQKTVAITHQLQCCLDNLVVTASTTKDIENIKYLQMILEGIHINAKHGNIEEAAKQFSFLSISLESLDCNCN